MCNMRTRAIRHCTRRAYSSPTVEEQGKKVTTSKRAREVCVGENAQPHTRDDNLTLSTGSLEAWRHKGGVLPTRTVVSLLRERQLP